MRIVFKCITTITDAKRTFWVGPDMLMGLAAEIGERNAREPEAATSPVSISQFPSALVA